MKKLLLLGGSAQQIPAIVYANKQGYYTVLCDYLPDNPGQHYASRFYCASTTDKEAVLEVAQREKVDGVVAYASDPAAPTAAYVAEKIGLPTNPYKSVEILAYKDRFRGFLAANGFNCPRAQGFASYEEAKESIHRFTLPVMIKPTDSSGSKGVRKVETLDELEGAYKAAFEQSRGKNIIIEEFIAMDHRYMIGGDCFVLNGQVVFWGLLNCHRDCDVNPLVPVGKSYPLYIAGDRIERSKQEIQGLVDLLGIRFGGFNIEIMFDNRDKPYLIEVGPRSGGNMIPDLLSMITGVDLVAATVEAALGNSCMSLNYCEKENYYSTYVLHTSKNGILKGIVFDGEIEGKILKKVIYKKEGDTVQYFDGANRAIGIVFLKFDSMDQMLDMMDHADKWIKVYVE
ncbi:MAG: ATP-grasp domain-containing protein [Clostridia bacterium]|nr:ATP-grasp domain-containing protein [Clostridia bacterium]